MLDVQSAAILTGVATEVFAQVYLLTIRPESAALKEKGEKFYNDHVAECQRLQRIAESDLAESVFQSPLRHLYEKPAPGSAEQEGKPLGAHELRKFEKEFEAIGSKFKESAAPGAAIGALRTDYTSYSKSFHSVFAGGVMLAAAVTYGALWYEVTSNRGPFSGDVVLLLFLVGLVAFGLFAGNLSDYNRLRNKIPGDEQRLLDAIHTKVQFSDLKAPPADVPAKAAPES